MIRLFSLICLLAATLALRAEEKAIPLYPFGNGVNFPTATEGVRFLKEQGYEGIGSVDPGKLATYKAACDAEGFPVRSVYLEGKVNGDDYVLGDEVAKAIAALAGTGAIVELNVQRGKDPNDAQAVAMVRDVADKAKAAGLRVVIYPHADFHIERVEHALEIAKATGRDNVGVAFNLCHFLKVQPGDDLAALLEEAKPLLWSVSVCGADMDGKDWNTLIRPLDEGSFDQAAFLHLLRDLGYEGAVGLQCFNIRIPSNEHLSRSMTAWKKHLTAANKP